MEEFDLGPNGAMVYCLEYLEKNVDWLMERLEGLNKKYLIFDFPGQVCVGTLVSCVSSVSASSAALFPLCQRHTRDTTSNSSSQQYKT